MYTLFRVHAAQLSSVSSVCCWEGRISVTADWSWWSLPLSVPSFVSAVLTAFCASCQWSFHKQESRFLWPLGERTVYLMSETSNKCLCSQCRNNPDKRRLWSCGEYERSEHGKSPVKSKKRLFSQPSSSVRNRKHEAVQSLLRALPPATLAADMPRKASFLLTLSCTHLFSLQVQYSAVEQSWICS